MLVKLKTEQMINQTDAERERERDIGKKTEGLLTLGYYNIVAYF